MFSYNMYSNNWQFTLKCYKTILYKTLWYLNKVNGH